MKQFVVLLIVGLVVVAAPLSADTRSGKVNPSKDFFYEVFSFFGGQMNATLTWQKKGASLFMVMVCGDGVTTLEWGVAAADQDRTQRLDVGVLTGLSCVIGVSSFSGASKFYLNVQETSDADPVTVSSRIPGGRAPAPPYAETRALLAKAKSLGRLQR